MATMASHPRMTLPGTVVIMPDGRVGTVIRQRYGLTGMLYLEIDVDGGGRVCHPSTDCQLRKLLIQRKRERYKPAEQLEFNYV
jgi:hypothetical protein